MERSLRILPALCATMAAASAGCLVAIRSEWIPSQPELFATLVLLTGILLLAEGVLLALALRRKSRSPVRAFSGIAIVAGLLVLIAGGTVNWFYSLQGATFLMEGETTPLSHTSQLQAFEAGPMSDLNEMRVVVRLEEVELISMEGGFVPKSSLEIRHGHDSPSSIEVAPRESRRVGSLWFHQGAFGFAPRVVITRGERTLFDRHVPFLTRRMGTTGTSFTGEFDIEAERISVNGEITLDTLDERMRGHSTLFLGVRKDGTSIGEGTLLPGHFADLGDGYRIGYAGLKKWSEIDVSRRNYATPMLAGAAIALAGVLSWFVAIWRNR